MTPLNLTDVALENRFEKLVRTERKITHLVLECIAEIDRRKLYLDRAYPSLFEYLTQVYGYSAAAAQRRIAGARLLGEVPEVAPKIQSGRINLSQIALAVQTINAAEKKFAAKMDGETKLDLFEKLETKSFAETQRILSAELKVETKPPERIQHHADGSVTLTLTLTREQYADWVRAGEMASHTTGGATAAALLHCLAKKEIARRTEIRRPSSLASNMPTSESEVGRKPSRNPRQIPPNLRKTLLRHSACEYRDSRTGKVCGSRRFLQIDHIHPVRDGGSRELANLRPLCGAHNRHRSSPPLP